ncbi:MAG: hypothetical protein WBX01_03595 [Nitrososphaeraceae archaeon]
MAKKSDASIVPVDIYRLVYNKVSKKANERDVSIRKFVNDLLKAVLKKYDFLEQAFPELQLDVIGKKSLYIKDYSSKKADVTAEVRVGKSFKLWCSLCNADDCKHVHFSEIIPDIGHVMSSEYFNSREK